MTFCELLTCPLTFAVTPSGFTLNEYCIRPVGDTGQAGEPIPVSTEEEIFEIIDLPYKKPEERNL